MPEGTPIDGSQERISSIDGPKIRFWHEEAVKQGMKSHERPVIILSDTMSATSYLPSKPVQYSSMSGLLCELRRDLCRAPAIEIVDEAGINWISIKIQFERGTNSRSRVVLLVVVSDTSRQELWEETTISLYEMLYVQNATNLDIILKAPDEPEERCFAIAYDHPLIPTWDERLKEPICEFLQRQHYHWTTMSVFQYGTSPDTAKPTVVVSVANLQEEDIPALEGDLEEELSRLGAPSLRAKIVEGSGWA